MGLNGSLETDWSRSLPYPVRSNITNGKLTSRVGSSANEPSVPRDVNIFDRDILPTRGGITSQREVRGPDGVKLFPQNR